MARAYFNYLRKKKIKRGKIVYAKEINLSDGTSAYESLILWNHPTYGVNLATLYIVVKKGDVVLAVYATTLGNELSEEYRKHIYSLKIE